MKLKKQDHKYELLKQHAEEKLEEANKEIDNIARGQVWKIHRITLLQYLFQEAEIAKLTAMLKKTEMKAVSFEENQRNRWIEF